MKKEIIDRLKNAVVTCNVEDAANIAKEALKAGVDPVEAVEEGLAKEIRIVGDR